MRTTLIITTATGDPLVANEQRGGAGTGQLHAKRVEFLNDEILPAGQKCGFDELIVSGRPHKSLRSDLGVVYHHVSPIRRDRSEALNIREQATRLSTGDILVYSSDDHKLSENFLSDMPEGDWDVLTPKRLNGSSGNEMNSGAPESKWFNYDGYSPAHCNVLKRRVWAKVPWTSIQRIEAWDIPISTKWKEAGFRLEWTDKIWAIDLEAREGEE
ncbi:hypothetical protein LCGC14_2718310 [marine sediment metagenome]|uniref:Glycosyltransferase 2-like domain-containing protein n=1 Tax=marine sediment metagenome TaxID=412755 RepID=A0A0F9BJZ3_9ZZZZ